MNIIFKSLGSFIRILFSRGICGRPPCSVAFKRGLARDSVSAQPQKLSSLYLRSKCLCQNSFRSTQLFLRPAPHHPLLKPKTSRHTLLLLSLVVVLFLKFTPTISAEIIDKVVAVVNDEVITQNDVEKSLKPISAQYAATYKGEKLLQKLVEARQNIINKLIENKLILAEAESMAIEVSDEEAEARVEGLMAQFPSRDAFETVLLQQGLRLSDLKDNYRNQIIIQRVINAQVKSKVVVKPAEVVDYYYTHLDDFTNPQEMKVSHILIRVKNNAGASSAYQRAKKTLTLIENGADFAQVAREHSDGPQKNAGGNLGFVGRDETIKEMDAAIFKLKVGEVSGLVKSELGYHIIKVEDKRLSYIKDLDQVNSEIEDILFREKVENNFVQWMNKLKEDAYISIKKE